MKALILPTLLLAAIATDSRASGDIHKGERDVGRCLPCHAITNGDRVIRKGDQRGPNLFGIIGRPAGQGSYAYSEGMRAAAAAGLVWDEARLTAFLEDPSGFLSAFTGSPQRSKMSLRMRGGGDVAAYLAEIAAGETPDAEAAGD